MDRRTVFSSNIRSIGFDARVGVLEIEFCSGGIYQYSPVPEDVYTELMQAPSVAKYYQHRIKEHFSYERVGQVEHID